MNDAKMTVSIVIPLYNEALAIVELLRRVCSVNLPDWCDGEVVIVDDGSTDQTMELIREFVRMGDQRGFRIKIHDSLINHGKGAALRAGFKMATGEIFLIQDGDLEYSPADYPSLLSPFRNENVDIVYGSRFHKGRPKEMKWLNLVANIVLSRVASLLFGQRITDEATAYKVFRRRVLDHFELHCRGFEFCPEFTGKAMRAGFSIHEVPIEYNPRGILEGKKIRAVDGVIALFSLIRVRFSRRSHIVKNPVATVGQLHSDDRR